VIRRHPERGFSLIAAIFVILVLGALGLFAVRVGTTQQQTAAFDLSIARAQAAADSGIEYGANRALKAASCPVATTTLAPAAPGMSGFTITVTCSALPHSIGPASPPPQYSTYFLTSTARRGTYGKPDFVSRTVTRTVNNAPP
jgi:MSHA biogenesis protein MshP